MAILSRSKLHTRHTFPKAHCLRTFTACAIGVCAPPLAGHDNLLRSINFIGQSWSKALSGLTQPVPIEQSAANQYGSPTRTIFSVFVPPA